MPLALRNPDVLPAKEAGIDGPCTRSNHCQTGTKGRQHDGLPGIASTRKNDPHLGQCNYRSHRRGPQADEEK